MNSGHRRNLDLEKKVFKAKSSMVAVKYSPGIEQSRASFIGRIELGEEGSPLGDGGGVILA